MSPKQRSAQVFGFILAMVLLLVMTTGLAEGRTQEEERIEEAIRAFEEILDLPEEGMPEYLLKECHGIAIIPSVVKVAYGIGAQYGKGVVLLRRERGWSSPAFIRLIGGSAGWQIGIQKSDIILVFKTPKSVENITHGKITLGADISVAAGPVGRRAEASTDLDLEAEILSYAKTKGLFAGVSIKGASIQIDHEANEGFYDDYGVSARDILIRDRVRPPRAARKLMRLLNSYTHDPRLL